MTGERIIAVEEHFADPALVATYDAVSRPPERLMSRLCDFAGMRLEAMDAAGIETQVIGHNSPSTQLLGADDAVAVSRGVNDRLAAALAVAPKRLLGYAVLPTADPAAAADELQRTVEEFGFVGAMINGLANGRFLDHRDFWPIFERAAKLDVPIYLHPSLPHPEVSRIYYDDYADDYPMVPRAAPVETATQVIRLVLSGVFDVYPGLKFLLGRLGETLPYQLWRINQTLARPGQKEVRFAETFRRHFWVSTSGLLSTPALTCAMMELGVDRILFSIDYPFVANEVGIDWINTVELSPDDRRKILAGNAEALFRLAEQERSP